MSGLFSAPKPPMVPPPPTVEDTAVQEAVAEAARRRARARGFRSTILTREFLSPEQASLKPTLGS